MTPPPKWFTIVAIVALLWNLLGCLAFFAELRITTEDVARMPAAQQALYAARPDWAVVATAVAVFGGVLGCIGLLVHRKWALILLALSLIGLLVQDFGLFVLAGAARLAGPVPVVMQAVVLVVSIALVMLSRRGIARGWLT